MVEDGAEGKEGGGWVGACCWGLQTGWGSATALSLDLEQRETTYGFFKDWTGDRPLGGTEAQGDMFSET